MAKVSNRVDKVADLLKKELAVLIQSEVRDPRVGMASVTGVKVSRDLSYANVYMTFLDRNNDGDIAEALAALNKAGGYLRSLLAKNVSLRTTPKLTFIYDDSLARGRYMTDLIDEALASDKAHHRQNGDDGEE